MLNHSDYKRRATPKPTCPDQAEVTCQHCNLFGFLKLFEKIRLDPLNLFLSSHHAVAKDETLFRGDSPFHGIYAVKRGSFKSYILLDKNNREQIQDFHLPGELLGLDSINSEMYGCYAVALEASSVCLLPFKHLDELGENIPMFQEQVIKILVEQVKHEQRQAQLVGRRTAGERLGAFILNLAERYAKHGFASNEFRIPMLQNDIANYLGLSMETVSRTLKTFRDYGLLSIKGKRVQILNPACLHSMDLGCLGSLDNGK